MVLDSRGYVVQDLFGRGFKKLVPLRKDSAAPSVEKGGVLAIADDPRYWNAEKLSQYYHRFHNAATTFGPHMSPENDGTVVYNHCLDVDSNSVRQILEPYMPEILKLTCVVKTKKGLHIHWCEHTQHERIGSVSAGRNVRRCTAGFEFEIKTDHKGGLSHLPPSDHLDDVKAKLPQPFRYQWMEGCAHKVAVIDNFMGSGLGLYDFLLQPKILGQYVREPTTGVIVAASRIPAARIPESSRGASDSEARDGSTTTDIMMSSTANIMMSENEESSENGTPLPTDVEPEPVVVATPNAVVIDCKDLQFKCADRIHLLIEQYYVQPHRNNAMLAITGAIRRSNNCGISYGDASGIISEFCTMAGDEETAARLRTLEATFQKENANENGTFAIFDDIISALRPEMENRTEERNKIELGVRDALDDFFASVTLANRPNIEINKSSARYIVVFENTVEEVEFPELLSKYLNEHVRKAYRKSLLLSAAPIARIKEVWDPIYAQTKYDMTFSYIGEAGKALTKSLGKLMSRDELFEWLRSNANFYYKPGRLEEAVHAIVTAYAKMGLVDHKVGTEIEGLVFLPNAQGQYTLVLSNMDRPVKPRQEQARDCIKLMQDAQTRFYGDSELEAARYAHFLKIGVVAPIDFARRQSGAVDSHDIIPRQDLGGWTDSGKTKGYAAIPLRMYRLPLTKGVGRHSHVVGSGSIDTAARFIEQTRWTTLPIVFDEADRYNEWQEDREARRILSIFKNSTQLTNPRDTLTSDSEQITKPSAAYVMLTHNSALIQEDGFNKRCTCHEFTIKDQKIKDEMDDFNDFWNDDANTNGHTFGYLGDFILNYYLDHPDALRNKYLDIARTVLHEFYCDAAGFSEDEFNTEWDSWLGQTVESATGKDGLIKARTANIVAMIRQMVNDGWAKNRQTAAVWIATYKDHQLTAGEHDYWTDKARRAIDNAIATATFVDKLEALVKTDNLTFLLWNEKLQEITIDSSIVDEMANRYRIYRVSHKSLADLLGFRYDVIRFGKETKRVICASLYEFADQVAPKGEEA